MSKNEKNIKLNNFLKEHEVSGDGVYHTHTAFGDPWKKYDIPDELYDEFMSLYIASVAEASREHHMIERPKRVGPLLIDFDFKYKVEPNKSDERRYSEIDIKYVVKVMNSIILKYVECGMDNLKAFVLEKEIPTYLDTQGECKDGFHIHYPYLPLTDEIRYVLLYELRMRIEADNAFSEIHATNKLDDIVDVSPVAQNGWLMYGSRKYNGKFYMLSCVFKNAIEKETKKMKVSELIKILSNRKFGDNDALKLKSAMTGTQFKQKLKKTYEHYKVKPVKANMKVKLSDVRQKEMMEKINAVSNEGDDDSVENGSKLSKEQEKIRNDVTIKVDRHYSKKNRSQEESDIRMARRLVRLLSADRAENYDDWVKVGWALHNISPKLLGVWKEFSKRSERYDEASCDKYWERARDYGLSLASLKNWARIDSPSQYIEIVRSNIREQLEDAETGTEYDISVLVYEIYKDIYKCTSITHQTWYEFTNHRWVDVEKAHTLSMRISSELTKEFAMLNAYYFTQVSGLEGTKQDTYQKKADNIIKIMNKLKQNAFKKKILEESSNKFKDSTFEEKLDSNRDLIGFSNGIYDLANGTFRPGNPDDYVSMTVGYDYQEYTMDHPYVKDIEKYFREVQPEDDMRDYVLTLMASYLDGHTKKQKFIIWTGGGGNGKSTTIEFFQLSFGDYCGVLPITLLTRKRGGSSSATPELAMMRGKRFVVLQEPENDDQINVGYMKELSGGDYVYARPLYKEPFKYKPQFKLLLVCNRLPQIPSTDGGTWRRIRVSPWESEFVDVIVKEGQHLKDEDLTDKMMIWRQAFMWYLLTVYYPKYKKEGIKEPAKVTQHSDNYKKKSDLILSFLMTNYEKTDKTRDSEKIVSIYGCFKSWYGESCTGKCPFDKANLEEYFANNKYQYYDGVLYGYKYKFKSSNREELDTDN